ncbi:MAG: hypothetical protein CML68_16385 [Rhodobacteraceae bacterium]|nr:hypothetical protein [Paracoccaceae bacterium]
MAQTFLIRADRVIDGVADKPVDHGAVLVEGDRILAVGRAADLGAPDGATMIDAPGATLMPGLIDAHVHLAYSGASDKSLFRSEQADLNWASVALRAAKYARDSLRMGFTGLRDMHGPGGAIIDLARAIDAGHVDGPRIVACGQGLSITGGHMDPPGWADHATFDNMTCACDGPDGFVRGVRQQIKRGARFIKLNTCTSTSAVPGRYCRFEMSPAEIRAACDEAHLQGYMVAAHTIGEEPLAESIRCGVDCVEHAHFTDPSIIELMVERGTWFVPTLLVNERNFELTPEQLNADARHMAWLEASREAKWKTLEMARKAGVKIASGTDAGFLIPHADMNWRELALLEQGGLTAMEAIRAATAANADLLGIDAGRLQEGRLADMVLVDGDPLSDLSVLSDQARLRVFLGGREIQ